MRRFVRTTFRNWKRDATVSLINLAGLTLGMFCTLLILVFVFTELSYDRYQPKSEQIYRLISHLTLGGSPNMIATTNGPPGQAMVTDYPEVLASCLLLPRPRSFVKSEVEEYYEDNMFYADNSFWNIFEFTWIEGSAESSLVKPYTAIITEEIANKYFGDEEALGQTLKMGDERDYEVTGVIEGVPRNTHFSFDFLLSFETLLVTDRERHESWTSSFRYHTYLLLEKTANPHVLERKLPDFVERHIGDAYEQYGASVAYSLQPLNKVHLYSSFRHEIGPHSDIKYIVAFALAAFLVLLISCFNYINLSTARSVLRSKEVGVKKILGAGRKKIIAQFLGESQLLSLIAFFLALGLMILSLPFFQNLSGSPLLIDVDLVPKLILPVALLPLIVGCLAGTYPALLLSGTLPLDAIKLNLVPSSGRTLFRNALVVFQFVMSITLIIGVALIFQQLNFMKNKDLGFNQDQVIIIPLYDTPSKQALEELGNELTRNPSILAVSASSHVPGNRPSGGAYQPEGYPEGHTIMMDGMSIDDRYLDVMGIQLVAGRNFSSTLHPGDSLNSILINETAAREIGWLDPVGKKIKKKTVVGVIKDFHYQYPQKPIRPLYITNSPGERSFRSLSIKLSNENLATTLDYLAREWRNFDQERELDYVFLDQSYASQYFAEKRLSQIFLYFAGFSVFIACLGVLGMSMFSIQRRRRELGIRKVMGASIFGILKLLVWQSVKTVGIAFMVAIPIAYYLGRKWLEGFAFRIHIGIEVFLLSGILIVLVTLLTVSYHSGRAALRNPVDSLRYE